jgi:hypothetical protein
MAAGRDSVEAAEAGGELVARKGATALLSAAPILMSVAPCLADESGASAWLPGQFASFAAVPGDPGFALETIYYHRQADAAVSRTFTVGTSLVAGVATTEQYLFVTPSYAFADPVLGGQLFVAVTLAPGRVDTSTNLTLTGPMGNSIGRAQADTMTGIGDLYPLAALKWSVGPHNVMAYAMPSIPVGAYDANRIAGLGLGHWSIDGGLGYTFMSESGWEFSLTAGLTHNFMNPYTQYQSGTDGHLDWGVSYSPTETFYAGIAGYFYNQLGADSGAGARLGPFQSKVTAVGPQLGYGFVVGRTQIELDLRGYKEFDAQNRPEGWNLWLTVSVSRTHRRR